MLYLDLFGTQYFWGSVDDHGGNCPIIPYLSYLYWEVPQTDRWIAYPKIISKVVKDHALDVVCMIKRLPKIHYTYEGESYTLNKLYKKLRKKRGRAKILASVVVGLRYDNENGNANTLIEST